MENEKMKGVVDGFYLCGQHEGSIMSNKIYNRNVPDSQLEAMYSFRSVPTRYVKYPALNTRVIDGVSDKREFYSVEDTFNPGNAKGPYSGYVKNLDLENNLRNSYFALQKCNQSVYVPSSESNLYNSMINDHTNPKDIAHSLLFEKQDLKPFNPDPKNKSYKIFSNHTRVQRNSDI